MNNTTKNNTYLTQENDSRNKGTALTQEERKHLNVLGKYPYRVETLSEQVSRTYTHYLTQPTLLQKNFYLRSLFEGNETVFYSLVSAYLKEILPVIYTPTVGTRVQQFSQAFLKPRGLTIAYPDQEAISDMLAQYPEDSIAIAVMTDGERVLGLGDQGIGGIEICIAKSMLYSICGGISPKQLLPICLDVGTDNETLLKDEHYLGWRHPRVRGADYDNFVEKVVRSLKARFPSLYLHWEDFSRDNARRLLNRYQDVLCTFNDDMQGTGAVTLSAALSAVQMAKSQLKDQRIVILGAGTAGTGIADQLCQAMHHQGLSLSEAQSRVWLLDSKGLVIKDSPRLTDFQAPYARPVEDRNLYQSSETEKTSIDLFEVVKQVKPTFLIGCSGKSGAFTQEIVTTMASQVECPIIFPLSNPNEKSEATPVDLLNWTHGKALIAIGSPFGSVEFQGNIYEISQCNNAFVFPGIGLGIQAAQATQLTESMLWAACLVLRDVSANQQNVAYGNLLPSISEIANVSKKIALAVALEAYKLGLAKRPLPSSELSQWINKNFWSPGY